MWSWYFDVQENTIDAVRRHMPGDDTMWYARARLPVDVCPAEFWETVKEITFQISKFEASQ